MRSETGMAMTEPHSFASAPSNNARGTVRTLDHFCINARIYGGDPLSSEWVYGMEGLGSAASWPVRMQSAPRAMPADE